MSWPALRLFAEILRREGWSAIVDRLRDRAAERRWHASFQRLPVPDARDTRGGSDHRLAGPPVLKILATPPSPRFGGVPTQLLHRFRHEEELCGAALLFPLDHEGKHLRLAVGRGGRRYAVDLPLASGPAHEGLVQAAATACRWLGIDLVHLENLAPLSPSVALGLAGNGRRLILTLHDFFAFCRRPHLVEEPHKRFCHYSRDLDRCARCLSVDSPTTPDGQARWRRSAAVLAASTAALVFPSDFLARKYSDLLGFAPQQRHYVIPPAVPDPDPLPHRRPGRRHGLRFAFVGGTRVVKGWRVLVDLVHRLETAGAGGLFDLIVLGGGDPAGSADSVRSPRVRVRGHYRSGRLPHLLRLHGIDLALLLSPVPESYGLALDECRWAGVPVLAFNHGALGQRIRATGGGVLAPPDAGVEGLTRILLPLLRDRQLLAAIPPVPEPPTGAVAAAARRHLELYAALQT